MIEWLIPALGIVFSAGVAWGISTAQAKAVRRELNGLGKHVRQGDDRNAAAHTAFGQALLASCPADQRIEIATLLKD